MTAPAEDQSKDRRQEMLRKHKERAKGKMRQEQQGRSGEQRGGRGRSDSFKAHQFGAKRPGSERPGRQRQQGQEG